MVHLVEIAEEHFLALLCYLWSQILISHTNNTASSWGLANHHQGRFKRSANVQILTICSIFGVSGQARRCQH